MSEPANYKSLNATVAPKQSVYAESAVQEGALGATICIGDRVYKYSYAGAALVAGDVVGLAANTQVVGATATAAAIGTKEVSIYGAAAITAGVFDEGIMVTNDSAGQGYAYRIKTQPICSSAGRATIVLYDPLVEALTAVSKISLHPNINKITNVITTTTPIQGVACCAVTSGNYCWIQQEGVAAMKVNGTIAFGNFLVPATTGGVTVADVTANAQIIGRALSAGTTADHIPVLLSLQNK